MRAEADPTTGSEETAEIGHGSRRIGELSSCIETQ